MGRHYVIAYPYGVVGPELCRSACLEAGGDGRAAGGRHYVIAYPYGVVGSLPPFSLTPFPSQAGDANLAPRKREAGRPEGAESEVGGNMPGYAFRYRLPEIPEGEPPGAGRLAEMVRKQLRNILDIAMPRANGKDVIIDSFRFLPEGKSHELFPPGDRPVRRTQKSGTEGRPVMWPAREAGRVDASFPGDHHPLLEPPSAAGESAGRSEPGPDALERGRQGNPERAPVADNGPGIAKSCAHQPSANAESEHMPVSDDGSSLSGRNSAAPAAAPSSTPNTCPATADHYKRYAVGTVDVCANTSKPARGAACRGRGDVSGDAGLHSPRAGVSAAGHREGAPLKSLENAALYEPRVEFIARQLTSLLSVVELECGGKPVRVDGFRLRDLDDWVGPHAATPADVFQHAATRCRFDCVFCYNRGAPPSLAAAAGDPADEWEELLSRLERYDPRSGTGLFPAFGGPREILDHPHALRLLRELRKRTDAPFRLATNGEALDRRCIAELASLEPVFLDVSLHSSSPRRRAMLMGVPDPGTAIAALPQLAEAGIPFAVTVVAWPLPTLGEMVEDLMSTAQYAEASGARMLQVNLPGYSRFFSSTAPFHTGTVWPEVVRAAADLRGRLSCPVFVSPAMYEENITRTVKNRAEVIGVVPGSPTARAGLAAGDVVTAVNGARVKSRPQARDLLSLAQAGAASGFAMTVERGGVELVLAGETDDYGYPYDPRTASHLGAVFMGTGFRTSYLDDIQAAVHARGARRPLLLTSSLVRPTLEQLLRERPLALPEGCSLALGVPENRYFGGNIILGDLLVVDDFVSFIAEYGARKGEAPDLVLIPSSPFHLSGWGRDLTGRPYLDIERSAGIPVELLRCETIWE